MRYGSQDFGCRGRRDRDEDVGSRGAGLGARVHADLGGQPVALAQVARRAGGDDVVPRRAAAARARDHVVHGEVRAGAAVLAVVAVAGEHGAARDLARLVARHAHEVDEPDHQRVGVVDRGAAQLAGRALQHLGLVLQHEHDRALQRADVDGLVGRVEHQDLLRPSGSSEEGVGGGPRAPAPTLRARGDSSRTRRRRGRSREAHARDTLVLDRRDGCVHRQVALAAAVDVDEEDVSAQAGLGGPALELARG